MVRSAEPCPILAGSAVATLFVTHHIQEAVQLGDRVLVLSPRPAKIVREIEIDLPHPRDIEVMDSTQAKHYIRWVHDTLSLTTGLCT